MQKNIVDKETLAHLVTEGTTNTGIAKMFKVHQNIVTLWIKENELDNALEEPTNDIFIVNALKKVLDIKNHLR